MSDAAAPALRERVEDFIAIRGRRVGDEGVANSLVVSGDGPDAVYVTLREDIQTGGSLALRVKAGDRLDDDLARLEEMTRRTLRARARLRSIGGVEDVDHPAPEWSFTLHRMMDGVLRNVGVDPLWLIPPHHDRGGRKMMDLAIEDTTVGISGITTEAGRIHIDVLKVDDEPRMLLWENREGRGVRIAAHLPDTVVMALAGSRLGDVFDHPLLAPAADSRIARAYLDGNVDLATVVLLEDDPVPVRNAPEGTDMRWTRMPY